MSAAGTDETLPHERREQVLNLWNAGATSAAIARRLRYSDPGTVRTIVSSARVAGDPRAKIRPTGRKPRFKVFEAEARRRGMTPAELLRAIQVKITEDNLFAAVLDD